MIDHRIDSDMRDVTAMRAVDAQHERDAAARTRLDAHRRTADVLLEQALRIDRVAATLRREPTWHVGMDAAVLEAIGEMCDATGVLLELGGDTLGASTELDDATAQRLGYEALFVRAAVARAAVTGYGTQVLGETLRDAAADAPDVANDDEIPFGG